MKAIHIIPVRACVRACVLGGGGVVASDTLMEAKEKTRLRAQKGSNVAIMAKPSPTVPKSQSKAQSLNQLQRNQLKMD